MKGENASLGGRTLARAAPGTGGWMVEWYAVTLAEVCVGPEVWRAVLGKAA